MITKELLSKVLNVNVTEVISIETDFYSFLDLSMQKLKVRIEGNLYFIELYFIVYMCKKWAMENGYEITENSDIACVYKMSDANGTELFSSRDTDVDFNPERIFIVSEYILNP